MAVLPLTLSKLHKIMRRAPKSFLDPLNDAMEEFDIDNAKRVAGFLAQLAVESAEMSHTHERWSSAKDFKLAGVDRPAFTAKTKEEYFEHWYGNRVGLGNDKPGDGFLYRGRGAIQITGKLTYRAVGEGIDEPLVATPDLLESDVDVDMRASAFFFARYKNLNGVADKVHPASATSIQHTNHALTKGVNGGFNGLLERLHYYRLALKALH